MKTDPTPRGRVLIVDDDPIVADSLAQFLMTEGYTVSTCSDGLTALSILDRFNTPSEDSAHPGKPIDLVITDVSMPGMDGIALLEKIGSAHPDVVAIMLTGYSTIESAVLAIRKGAFDYLSKPVIDSELRFTLEKALRQQHLVKENTRLKGRLEASFGPKNIVGNDHRMRKAFEMIDAVASSTATVLMTGESGTGKSLIANAIHQQSDRANGAYIELYCGSISETLLESELFGHVKGSFTGAHTDKQGKFLAADGGTLFIDEINSASPAMQLKLLRVLQERRFEPVGSTETIEVDVRVILACNQSLEELVARGDFREDLYYRINVVKIDLPPLRERAGDIPSLVDRFIEKHARQHNRTITGISDDTMNALLRYTYPGNVRELENIIERAVVLSRRPTITMEDLPPNVLEGTTGLTLTGGGGAAGDAIDAADTPWIPTPLVEAIAEPEKRIILKALRANQWNRQKTASDLAINRTTLYKKMKTLGIDKLAG